MKLRDLLENCSDLGLAVQEAMMQEELKKDSGKRRKYTLRKEEFEKDIKIVLSTKIKEIMLLNRLSMAMVARRTGLARTMIFKVLKVEGTGSIGVLLRILDVLGYKMEFEVREKE